MAKVPLMILVLLTAATIPGCLGFLPGSESNTDTPPADDAGDDTGDDTGGDDTGGDDTGGDDTGGDDTGGDDTGGDDTSGPAPPVASFTIYELENPGAEVARGFENTFLVFDATNATDGNGGKPVNWTWEVYEGGVKTRELFTEKVERYNFENVGAKKIRLTVRNAAGLTHTIEKPYNRDLLAEGTGSHTWGNGLVAPVEHTDSRNITVPADGRNGYLKVTWTLAQAAKITLTSPDGTALVDEEIPGGEAVFELTDASTFAVPGAYRLDVLLKYTPDTEGVPVYVGAEEAKSDLTTTLAVYFGEAVETVAPAAEA